MMHCNLMFILAISLCAVQKTIAIAPKDIPKDLLNAYTMNGKALVKKWYFDNSYPPNKPLVYTKEWVQTMIDNARSHKNSCYGKTDAFLRKAFTKYQQHIKEKNVAIMGSAAPRYEGMVLAYEGHPTTIEYNKIICQDTRVKVMTVDEYAQNPQKFDAIVSISSFEHDGLGRYGDPLDPDGDLKAMDACKTMLNPGGLLFLAVPVGRDHVVWNAHRIYGKFRLPLLLEGWSVLDFFDTYPTMQQAIQKHPVSSSGSHSTQPVLVLQVKST